MKKIASRLIISALVVNLAGCGTLLYPERMGQRHSSQVDIKVAVADGIGLLFFIIPGVIAFAVDYHYGTIYLPHQYGENAPDQPLKVVKTDRKIDHAYLESLLESELNVRIDLDAYSTLIEQNRSLNEVRLLGETSGS